MKTKEIKIIFLVSSYIKKGSFIQKSKLEKKQKANKKITIKNCTFEILLSAFFVPSTNFMPSKFLFNELIENIPHMIVILIRLIFYQYQSNSSSITLNSMLAILTSCDLLYYPYGH